MTDQVRGIAYMGLVLSMVLSAVLAACGGGDDSSGKPVAPPPTAPSPVSYTIGGTVSELSADASLVLLDNNGDSLTITSDGAFTFVTALAADSAYAVTVGTQPTGQTCTVGNASGTVTATNVTNVRVACANTPIALLELGHGSNVTQIKMTDSRALSQDTMGHWLLSALPTDTTVASGTSSCLSSSCTTATANNNNPNIPVALAGQTVVIETAHGLEIRAASDGHIEGTIPGPITSWSLASDGSYVITCSTTALQAWSLTGTSTFSAAGDYSKAVVFGAPNQVQVALGAAGANVIQSISLPGGRSSVGPSFQGTFNSWFLDGGRFLTNTSTTVWVYSSTSVQQDLTQLTSVVNLTGQGNWLWVRQSYASDAPLAVYAVGASTTPAATYTVGSAAVASALTIGIFPSAYASVNQVNIVDLSGATLSNTVHTLPVSGGNLAATSPTQWLVGSGGAVVDGTTVSTEPKYLSLGVALSIAGGAVAAIATDSGRIFVINPQTNVVQTTIDLESTKIELSSDGTVLAVEGVPIVDQYGVGTYTLQAYSLPSGTLIKSWSLPNPVDFSLAGSGTLIAQVTLGSSNTGSEVTEQQVTAVTGGPVLWSSITDVIPVLFSPDGTLFASWAGGLNFSAATDIYLNDKLATTVAGVPAGWIDNGRLLVNNYVRGVTADSSNYVSATIYDPTGTVLSTPPLPELTAIQLVSANTVYSPNRNAIYSVTTGQPTWTGPALTDYIAMGAVAGAYVVYPAGSQVVAVKY
jgi:hypothetical protein